MEFEIGPLKIERDANVPPDDYGALAPRRPAASKPGCVQ